MQLEESWKFHGTAKKKNWAEGMQKKNNAGFSFIYLSKGSKQILMSLVIWLLNTVQKGFKCSRIPDPLVREIFLLSLKS